MKSSFKRFFRSFFVASIFLSLLPLNSTFAQETKIQKELEAASRKTCDSSTLEELKTRITGYFETILCTRAGDVTDFGFCATRLISGAAFFGIGQVHTLDGKSELQRYVGRSEQIAKLEATNSVLLEELARSKNTRDVLLRGINGTDEALNQVIKLHQQNPNAVREQLMDKKLIHEGNIRDLEAGMAKNKDAIAKLRSMSLEKIASDLRSAKLMRMAGGALALNPAMYALTISDIGPDCNLRGLVSELDDKCVPLPVTGEAEIKLLYNKRLAEIAKISPSICQHLENQANMMELRVEALKKMYNEGITYSQPKCEPGKISYNVNGNEYIKNGEVILDLDKDGQIKKTFVKTGNLKYTLDYFPNSNQKVKSLSWESSNPNFPGVRQVSSKEIPSAMKQEVVERGMSFHTLNLAAGNAAITCCTKGSKSCQGFSPPTPAPTNEKKSSPR